jgi:hypothetical protein
MGWPLRAGCPFTLTEYFELTLVIFCEKTPGERTNCAPELLSSTKVHLILAAILIKDKVCSKVTSLFSTESLSI